MGKRIGEIERKYKRRSGLGSFFLGSFIGILLGIGIVAGLGALVYFKATPEWLNKTFKTDIDLGSDELNRITLNKIVKKGIYISNNTDKYTLADFEKDFGYKFPEKIKGVSIEAIKNKPIDKIGDGINEILNDVSINELSEIYTPTDDVNKLLNDKLTLYVKAGFQNGDKVYSDKACTEEVEFASIVDGKVKIKDISIMPDSENKVQFELKELPVLQGLPLYITHIGDNMTIKRLEENFGVTLPSIIKISAEDKEIKTINDLGDIIDNMYIADFLDYEYDETLDKVYKTVDGVKTEVTGAVATFAKKKVNELNTLDETIKSMKVYEVLDYKSQGGKYYEGENEVTGIMAKIAGYTVGTLSDDIQNLLIADILDYTISGEIVYDKNGNQVTGVLKSIASLTVGNMADQLQSKIDDMTIADVLEFKTEAGVLKDKSGNQVKGILKSIADLKIGEMSTGLQTKIDSITLAEVMDYTISGNTVTDKDGNPITGVMATIIKKNATIKNLPTAINNLAIYEALDYVKYENAGTTIYYKDDNNNGAYDAGEELTGVLSLIDVEKGITELSDEISGIFTGTNAKTLSQLQTAGVIGSEVDLTKKIKGTDVVLGDCTIDSLLLNIPTE